MALFKDKGASYELRTLTDVTSVDAYADVCVWTVAGFKTKVMTFSATTNNLKVTTYYSNDFGLSWTELDAEFTVTTAAAVAKTSTTVYGQIKITVKSASAGNAGVLSVRLFGTSLS